jgi:hypothetical protein
VKVKFSKRVSPSSYQFQPVHLIWTGVHVAVGAMLSHIVASRFPDGKTAPDYYFVSIIGLVVFVGYNLISLIQNPVKSSARHVFFHRYRTTLAKVLAVCLLISAVLFCFVSPALLKPGLLTCIAAGLYMWAYTSIPPHHLANIVKEPIAAAIFAAGTWGTTWFTADMKNENILLGLVFFLQTLQTLLILAHFEALNRTKTQNIARWLGKALTRKLIFLVGGLICISCVCICFYTEFRFIQRVAVVLFVAGTAQAILFLRSGRPDSEKLVQTLPEFAGLLPLLLL